MPDPWSLIFWGSAFSMRRRSSLRALPSYRLGAYRLVPFTGESGRCYRLVGFKRTLAEAPTAREALAAGRALIAFDYPPCESENPDAPTLTWVDIAHLLPPEPMPWTTREECRGRWVSVEASIGRDIPSRLSGVPSL